MNKTEAIKAWLTDQTHADLASLYSYGMECQVNVAKEDGEPIKGEFRGRGWTGYSNGERTWKPFRIPWNAKLNPEYTDSPMNYPLDKYAEGIGMTGWNWVERASKYVAFDFDAIQGHKNPKKLTPEELEALVNLVSGVNWVQTRRSTSGTGIHLYVYLPDVPTATHTEHAALARAVLGKLSAETGVDFSQKVDICGGNMWVWHRKMKTGNGLAIIKNHTEVLEKYPKNWRDHVNVVNTRYGRSKISGIETDKFEDLVNKTTKAKLDDEHRRLVKWMNDNNHYAEWNPDSECLVSHTIGLKAAHTALDYRGIFETISTGSSEKNCFLFPLAEGAWSCRRFSPGVAEHEVWNQDGNGWTTIFFNREPDLQSAAKMHGGVETAKDGYFIPRSDAVNAVLSVMGSSMLIPASLTNRQSWIRPHKDTKKIVIEIESHKNDYVDPKEGWYDTGKRWQKVVSVATVAYDDKDLQYDDVIRHTVTLSNEDNGWFLNSGGRWAREPRENIKLALKADGLKDGDVQSIMGTAVTNCWTEVKKAFQPEYLGNRQWNRNSCQLTVVPSQADDLKFPTWMKIFEHIGANLTSAVEDSTWCRAHGIKTGADYLLCWVASMFQYPEEPLPYLFLYGPQNSGKSVLHESIKNLVSQGVVSADTALMNTAGFNSELESAILCYVEETDITTQRGAYNRIKDWVTSPQFTVHPKGKTPYSVVNTSHWIQCANDVQHLPIQMGDTRITVVRVGAIDVIDLIPKGEMNELLSKEASDFVAHILAIEIPVTSDRLRVPVIKSQEKSSAEYFSSSVVSRFISENYFYCTGHALKFKDMYDKFLNSIGTMAAMKWTKQLFHAELLREGKFCVGNSTFDNNALYVGNVWDSDDGSGVECKVVANKLLKTEDLKWK